MVNPLQALVIFAVSLRPAALDVPPPGSTQKLQISVVMTYLCIHSKDFTRTVLSDLMHSKDAEKNVKIFYTFPGIDWYDVRYSKTPSVNTNGFNITNVDKWLGCMTVQKNTTQLDMFNAVACIMALDWRKVTTTAIKKCMDSNKVNSHEAERCATGEAALWLLEKSAQDTKSLIPPFIGFPTVNVDQQGVYYWPFLKEFVCNQILGVARSYCNVSKRRPMRL